MYGREGEYNAAGRGATQVIDKGDYGSTQRDGAQAQENFWVSQCMPVRIQHDAEGGGEGQMPVVGLKQQPSQFRNASVKGADFGSMKRDDT